MTEDPNLQDRIYCEFMDPAFYQTDFELHILTDQPLPDQVFQQTETLHAVFSPAFFDKFFVEIWLDEEVEPVIPRSRAIKSFTTRHNSPDDVKAFFNIFRTKARSFHRSVLNATIYSKHSPLEENNVADIIEAIKEEYKIQGLFRWKVSDERLSPEDFHMELYDHGWSDLDIETHFQFGIHGFIVWLQGEYLDWLKAVSLWRNKKPDGVCNQLEISERLARYEGRTDAYEELWMFLRPVQGQFYLNEPYLPHEQAAEPPKPPIQAKPPIPLHPFRSRS